MFFNIKTTVFHVKKLLVFDQPPTCSFYMHVMVAAIMIFTIPFGWVLPNTNDLVLLILNCLQDL